MADKGGARRKKARPKKDKAAAGKVRTSRRKATPRKGKARASKGGTRRKKATPRKGKATADFEAMRQYGSLCEILNWTTEDVAQCQAGIARLFGSWQEYMEKGGAMRPSLASPLRLDRGLLTSMVPLIRRLGREIAANTTDAGLSLPPAPSEVELAYEDVGSVPEAHLAAWAYELPHGTVSITDEETRAMVRVASTSPTEYELYYGFRAPGETKVILGSLHDLPHVSTIVLATRALWAVLDGPAIIKRCAAKAAGRGSTYCERYFVTRTGVGRPRKYCSDNCAKRRRSRE